MMRCIPVLLLFFIIGACRKGKADKEVQEPLEIDPNDEIAFIAKKRTAPGFQLFLMKADGSDLRTLSGDTITNELFAVSHDGNRFVYSTYDTSRTGRLYIVDKRGGEAVLLSSGPHIYSSMSWSPDDRQLLFLKMAVTGSVTSDVFVIDSDGKNEQRLTTGGRSLYPHWFPDGSKIIFNSFSNSPGVYVMAADGSGARRIGLVGVASADAILSPAGDKIAFSFVDAGGGRSLLYVMNADGTGIRQIVVAPAPPPASLSPSTYRYIELSPSWSPDGSQLAYACHVDGNSDIFVVNADGSDNKRILRSREWEGNPVWTKDGRHIMYLANEGIEADPKVYIMRANGHSPTLVSKVDGYVMHPVFIAH